MRKPLLILATSCLACLHSIAQCVIPQGKGDTITPVTNNYLYDSTYGVSRSLAAVYTLARTGNQLYVSGSFTNIGPNMGSGVIVDGSSKTVLSSKAWKFNSYVRVSIPDGQGGFYVGGDFTKIGDSVRNHLAHIDATGRPLAWNPNVDRSIYSLVKKDDTLFLGGAFRTVGSQQRIIFAAWSLSGDSLLPYKLSNIDTVNGAGVIYSIRQAGMDKLFLGGDFYFSSSPSTSKLMQYDLKTGLTSWQPQNPIYGTVPSVDVSQDGKTVFSAEDSWGGIRANDIATGKELYTVQLSYVTGVIDAGGPTAIKIIGNTLYIAGSFNRANGLVRRGLCAVDVATGLVKDFNLDLNAPFVEYVDELDGNLVISGPFTKAGELDREHFLMVDTTAAHVISSWNPSPSDAVHAVCSSGGRIFMGGYFNGLQSVHRNQLAGFDGNTGAILPFAPPVADAGYTIDVGEKMVILGDTLFLLGRNDHFGDWRHTKLELYHISTGAPISVPANLGFTTFYDFLTAGNYLYAAVDNSIRRFTLPGLHLDAAWKVDYAARLSSPYTPAAHALCQDATNIYAAGDDRLLPGGFPPSSYYNFVNKINKEDASLNTFWQYPDSVNALGTGPHIDHAVLGDSILFVSGFFNFLNGKPANDMGAVNVRTGEVINWSPPFVSGLPSGDGQPGYYVHKLFLKGGALWTGLDKYNTGGASSNLAATAFGAEDSVSGAYLPTPINLTGRGYSFVADPYNSGVDGLTSANDFLFDPDYCTIVGRFENVNGELHGNIVRLSYGSYTPPAGLPAITGADTVTTSSDSVAYSLPASLAYKWSYTGNDTRIVDTSANPALLSFGANATSGLLTAASTGYCNTGHYTVQKNISVIHLPSKPTTAACCMSFSNILTDRVSLHLTAGNGSGRLVIASTSRQAAQPVKRKTYSANLVFGSGEDLGAANYAVYSGNGDSLTVTGLQPNTTYYFTVYEYNGAADTINYLTSAFASGNTATLPAEPTLPPSHISFSNVGKTSFTISCTPGNGFGRLYLLKAIDTIRASPEDGNLYLGDIRFQYGYGFADSSYVVGSFGSAIAVSNLKPGTLYQVKLFEYNGGGNMTNYLQSAYAADSVRTLSVVTPPDTTTGGTSDTSATGPTTNASNLHFQNIKTNSVQVSCAPGNGSYRLFIIRSSDIITNLPVNGQVYAPNAQFGKGSDLGNNTFVAGSSGTSVAITGLAPATLYSVAVIEANGSGSKTSYLTGHFLSQSFTTAAPGSSTTVNWQDSSFLVTVFPNPVQQSCHLRIISNQVTNLAIKVVGITGKQNRSYNYRVTPGPNDIELKDFAGLSRGIYIIYWSIQGNRGSTKVYKE